MGRIIKADLDRRKTFILNVSQNGTTVEPDRIITSAICLTNFSGIFYRTNATNQLVHYVPVKSYPVSVKSYAEFVLGEKCSEVSIGVVVEAPYGPEGCRGKSLFYQGVRRLRPSLSLLGFELSAWF
jgi:hypothetical protein